MLAILLSIEISLTNEHYMEESNLLSSTFLPYLNKLCDYSFLTKKHDFIMSRFIRALSDHVIDKQVQVEKGFIISTIKYEFGRIKEIVSLQ